MDPQLKLAPLFPPRLAGGLSHAGHTFSLAVFQSLHHIVSLTRQLCGFQVYLFSTSGIVCLVNGPSLVIPFMFSCFIYDYNENLHACYFL